MRFFLQGDRSEDLGLNDNLADSDARVRKCLQILLESTFLCQIVPTLGGCLYVTANLRSSERPGAPNVHSLKETHSFVLGIAQE